MRINPISTTPLISVSNRQAQVSQKSPAKSDNSNVSFQSYNPEIAKALEEKLLQKGLRCDFRGNDFVGGCVEKITDVFEKIFGRRFLPRNVNFDNIKQRAYGSYLNINDTVEFNEAFDSGCFYDLDNLKIEMGKGYHLIKPNWTSSLHPAHIFVHEFSHCAHWKHLKERNGQVGAERVWRGLFGETVPTSIGKLITRYKLSDYAVEGDDMCEFMAERMSQDICKGLTNDSWTLYKDIDVAYSDIFSRKWNYRYSSPQSYIDYFTQQVWNGDIEEAKRTGVRVEEYLKNIDTLKVPPLVNVIANTLNNLVNNVDTQTERIVEPSLIYKMSSSLSKWLVEISEKLTEKLNELNRVRIRNKDGELMS